MSQDNLGERGGVEPEPLPSFIGFEVRARAAGTVGLDSAIRRSSYPENMFTTEDLGMITPSIAIPYAKLLCGETNNGPGAAVAYNGYYFAAVVGGHLIGNVGSPTTPPYPRIFREAYQDLEGEQKALAERAAYLGDRPTLKAWIDRYLLMLDPLAAYPDVATTVAALTMRDIEEAERQGFIDAEAHYIDGFWPPEL